MEQSRPKKILNFVFHYETLLINLLEKDFSIYFDKNIDKDINKMGSWILRPYGVQILLNNQSESFNATMKRLMNWKRLSIDHMANSIVAGFYSMKIRRGRLGCRDYTISITLSHLQTKIVKNAVERQKFQYSDDLFDKIKSSRLLKKVKIIK